MNYGKFRMEPACRQHVIRIGLSELTNAETEVGCMMMNKQQNATHLVALFALPLSIYLLNFLRMSFHHHLSFHAHFGCHFTAINVPFFG